MSGYELLSDQGLRADGRRENELRRIRCRQGVFGQADGSAYLEQGNTKVLAAVYGPHEAGRRTGGGGMLDTVRYSDRRSIFREGLHRIKD